mmetsp:Transcript_31587/g.46619  ORF Transcript_31587/g.46619 Transcript_31587/m.46619 type:complete len:111 (+) Transcript_31587:2322-2654(+)
MGPMNFYSQFSDISVFYEGPLINIFTLLMHQVIMFETESELELRKARCRITIESKSVRGYILIIQKLQLLYSTESKLTISHFLLITPRLLRVCFLSRRVFALFNNAFEKL